MPASVQKPQCMVATRFATHPVDKPLARQPFSLAAASLWCSSPYVDIQRQIGRPTLRRPCFGSMTMPIRTDVSLTLTHDASAVVMRLQYAGRETAIDRRILLAQLTRANSP